MAGPKATGHSTAPPPQYDVAVLGAHLAGGLLATVLARQGLSVLLVAAAEDATEPAGETTVPYTAEIFFLLARRYDVPEIEAFGLASRLPAQVRRTSGVKHSLSFLHHRQGQEHRPEETVQFNVPGEHNEWHLYRPDVEAYARQLAVRYGATLPSAGVFLQDVCPDDDGVDVVLTDGTAMRARYVVDGSGPQSPLLARVGAGPEGAVRLLHRSRQLSTHMRQVRPFEEIAPIADYPRATAWTLGTLHHVFDGGWLQVVPFGNHPDGTNPDCSVTLSLDPDKFPEGMSPEADFRKVVGEFPSIARQFTDAQAVRPWTPQARTQAAVGPAAGPRYFLFERTAHRNDLVLSRDITTAAETIHALAAALVLAARTDDWGGPALREAAEFQGSLAQFNDRILAAAAGAATDFRLWNAFCRVWLLWQILAALSLKQARNACVQDTGPRPWKQVEQYRHGGLWFPVPQGLPRLLAAAFDECLRVRDGQAQAGHAADRIFALLRRAPFVPPLYRFADPAARYYHFTTPRRLLMLLWTQTLAPPSFRHMLARENVTAVPPAAV